jgi:DnaJ domain
VIETDPYVVLGVPRTASRSEIARAYRALARLHHPDAGAPATEEMARINEAWHILSDPARRALWDRRYTVIQPAPWRAPGVAEEPPARRSSKPPPAPTRPMETPQRIAGIAIGILTIVALIVAALTLSAGPPADANTFDGSDVSFVYPADWTLAAGEPGQDPAHRVIAHLVTFPVADDELCTTFDDACKLTGDGMPAVGASIVVTAWEGGTPRIADPVDLDDREIGGAPSAFRVEREGLRETVAWWQLSPPGFPDRWIEVRADIAGLQRERQDFFDEIVSVLDSLEFTQP